MNSFIRKIKTLFTIAVWLFRKPSAVAVPVRYGKKEIHKVENEFLDGLYVNQWGSVDVVIDGKVVCRGTDIGDFVFDEKPTEETEPLMENPYAKALALALLLSASVAFAWSGSGTYEDPYQIGSTFDWVNLTSAVAGGQSQSGVYFIQTADIDLQAYGSCFCGLPSAPFKGNYDGDGYIISNFTITTSVSGATTNAFGLFGYCEEATIENVSVYGKISVSADYNASACVGVGGVIGISVKGLFAGLHNYVDIDVKISNAPTGQASNGNIKYGVGGVVGLNAWTTNSGTLHIGCENYGNIYVDGANGETCVGGCFTANVPNEGTDTTFSGWNNYGKVVVNGTAGTHPNNLSSVAGIGAIRWNIPNGGTTRTPKFVGCSNFETIICSNSVNQAGIASKGLSYGNHQARCESSTNYADIVKVNNSGSDRDYTAGILADLDQGYDSVCVLCVNYGKIKASGTASGVRQIAGISARTSSSSSSSSLSSYRNKNFGDLEADCPNASSVVAGGVFSTQRCHLARECENYGSININTSGSVLIGGVSSMATQGYGGGFLRNCVNYGSIVANGNSNTNYSPCVGGVFASTRQTGSNTRNITISNCYFLGTAKLNLNSPDCYGAIYGVANTYGNYSVTVKNCYALLGEGENLIGAVDASNGNVSLENCVGIKSGREGGIAYSVIGSNNWSQANTTLVSYDDCYHTPSLCLGNLPSGIFYPAEKSADFFDLILPMNTQLYPTPSDQDKKDNSFTKTQGYKRYIRTIQQ